MLDLKKLSDHVCGFLGNAVVKNLPTSAGDIRDMGSEEKKKEKRDMGSIPGSGRSPGGGCGKPRQYSCLENLMERGA